MVQFGDTWSMTESMKDTQNNRIVTKISTNSHEINNVLESDEVLGMINVTDEVPCSHVPRTYPYETSWNNMRNKLESNFDVKEINNRLKDITTDDMADPDKSDIDELISQMDEAGDFKAEGSKHSCGDICKPIEFDLYAENSPDMMQNVTSETLYSVSF